MSDAESYADLFSLGGKQALVIGAGSGIGEAVAQGLGAFGAEVVCADLDEEKAAGTAAGIREAGGKQGPPASTLPNTRASKTSSLS